ncbi:MAG: GNAT family N-acetyltransferase [bacterium]|nr:MAG: GNAT family N-acetyltransferase [bacterium]
MSDLVTADPLRVENWDSLVSQHPGATIFHSARWARVLSESYGYRPRYFATITSGGLETLVPCMEIASFLTGRRGVSLPFTDSCPPLLSGPETFPDLLPAITAFGRSAGWRTFEARDVDLGPADGIPATAYLDHDLDLTPGPDGLKAGLRSSTARNIKKAAKSGVQIREENTMAGMREFCRLNSMTRREHGLPPQPFRFFTRLFDHVIAGGWGRVLLAVKDGRTAAGAVFLHFNGRSIYKYGASDRAFQTLRANNLVMWDAIRRYAEEGFASFSFGRTEPDNEGLRQFKGGWGASEREIRYVKYAMKEDGFVKDSLKTTGWHNRVFSRMPIPALNAVGTVLYRHMG